MKIAIIHDWLVTYAGAERVLEQMLICYPEADLFSIINFLPSNQKDFIQNKLVNTSIIQKFPFARTQYRKYLPLMAVVIEQFDLSNYDLIISSSHAVAKGIITGPNQLHLSYVHSPMRYAWDLQHQYLNEAQLDKGIKSWIAKWVLHKMRLWDMRTANGVDYFIANSHYIAGRIQKVYRRQAIVIYPPVDIHFFTLRENKEDFFLTASRMVPYKKIDLIVETFAHMPDKKLVVIGDGPDFKKIKSKARRNIIFLGHQSNESLRDYMQRARAFVFAAEEDFGIIPLEAQACGTPVIAYGKGGVAETIRDIETSSPTGVFFYEQTSGSLISGVRLFENEEKNIIPTICRENAVRFSPEIFRQRFRKFIDYQANLNILPKLKSQESQFKITPIKMSKKTILCIPILNAEKKLPPLLKAISEQTLQPDEFWVIDSSSEDRTVEILKEAHVKVHIIPRKEFNHGGTRNLFLELAKGDCYIYLTDDAIPANPRTFETILKVFEQDSLAGLAYGRQLPHQNASPFAAHARLFNYPEVSLRKTLTDISQLGIKTCFSSNSFAVYRAKALREIGGFPPHAIVSEDIYVASKMLQKGWTAHYVAESTVYHSHNYSVMQEFKRYFDIGVFYGRERWIQKTFGRAEGEGKKFLLSEFHYFRKSGEINFYFEWFLRNVTKWIGYKLGKMEKYLPTKIKRQISMHKGYWS